MIITHGFAEDTRLFAEALQKSSAEALRLSDEWLLRSEPGTDDELKWGTRSAVALRRLGDARGSRRLLTTLRRTARLSESTYLQGCHEHAAAIVVAELGDIDAGLEGYDRARRLFLLSGQLASAAASENNAALLLARLGRFSEAETLVDRAIRCWSELRIISYLAEAYDTKSQVYAMRRDGLAGAGRRV